MEDLAYELVRSRRRTMELRVFPDQRIQVRAPLKASHKSIDAFVKSRQGWLEKVLKDVATRPQKPRWQLKEGAICHFLGERYRLKLAEGEVDVRRHQGEITLVLPHDLQLEDTYQNLLESWYRLEAKAYFPKRIRHYFPLFANLGYSQPTLRVKKMKTRWGSLSTRGYINLNMTLMQYPPECIDEVVVHELCHLQEMNHGPRFKALQSRIMPDWPERKRRLEALQKSWVSPFYG